MPAASSLHPTLDQLQAFAQGRLTAGEMAAVEQHVAACDSCCKQLQDVPEDTLVLLAREAATFGFRSDARRLTGATPPEVPPELIDHPRYRVLGLVGVGGMGAVYKAEHRLMGRLVALKTISPAFLQNTAAVERFRREFRATAALSHPNIVTAFDADQAGDLHFLVMEFVEGIGLDRLVAQHGPRNVPQACRLIQRAALGLAHMHERGMVHRDIKPQNLMIGRGDQVKILDCGLARLASEPSADSTAAMLPAADQPGATTAGMILGTPDYIAPEQFADARSADIRSDIYSLGCTLFFALTGRPPFPTGSVVEKLKSHTSAAPPPVRTLRPDVPAELARILDRMLAKDPQDRYQTPGELARDLVPLTSDKASAKRPAAEPAATPLPAAVPAVPAAAPEVQPVAPAPEPLAPLVSDPLAGLALATTNLPPVVEAGRRTGSGFSASPMLVVAILLGLGVALAMLVLAVPLAWSLYPNGSPPDRLGSAPPTSSSPGLVTQPVPVAATGALPRRVLLVIPHEGLWLADYRDVKRTLEQEGIAVDAASTSLERSTFAKDSEIGEVYPDVLLDKDLHADKYGAIVFTGKKVEDYLPKDENRPSQGRAFEETRRLLAEFKGAGKLVTAICGGELVLAGQKELDGKRAAANRHADIQAFMPNCQANWVPESEGHVIRDGQLITAGGFEDAAEFARTIAAALKSK